MSIKGAGRGFSSGANFNPRNYTNEGRPSLIEEITEGSIKSQQQQQVKSDGLDGSCIQERNKGSVLDPPLKMRMISLLKSTFGEDDLIKIPGFSEFESATRQELIDFNRTGGSYHSHSNLRRIRSLYVDASTQTSLDLLDTFLRSSPRYSSKIVSSLNGLNSSTDAQGPSPFILGSNNLSGSGNNHQRIWESSQPMNGRQAWLVGQSSGSHSITGPIMMTAPIQFQGRNLIRAPSHATSNVQGLVTNYVPSSSGDVSTSMFVSETRGGMGLETTLSPSGLRMRVQQKEDRRVGGGGEPGNWSGSNKSHNILSAPLTLPHPPPSSSISFSTSSHHHHPTHPFPSHTGHYNIMTSQHQPLLSNLRTTSSGLPEPLPPPIDFSPLHTPLPLPHQVEQRFEQQQQRAIQQQQRTSRSRGSTTSTNQISSEESLHRTGVGGGITPGQGSVVEESASSGGDSSPSSSGAVYKNIIITLASSRIPSGHLREDDEDDDRERMTLGSFDDGEEEEEDYDEDLSLGPGLEHHHHCDAISESTTSCPPPPPHTHTTTTSTTHRHQQQQHPIHLKR